MLNRKIISQEEIQVIQGNTLKVKAISSSESYDFTSLNDRTFEILLYQIFKRRISDDLKSQYDKVDLMQGVGERGLDIALWKKGTLKGVVQCKRLKTRLKLSDFLEEIIKLSINIHLQEFGAIQLKDLTYYIASAAGFSGSLIKAIANLPDFYKNNNAIVTNVTSKILNKYSSFKNLDLEIIQPIIRKTFNTLSVEKITPEDLNFHLTLYTDISDAFFEIKKVTDNTLIHMVNNNLEKLIQVAKEKDPLIDDFISKYRKSAIEKLNTVNFLGFDLHRSRQRPNEITLTDLFVSPNFKQNITTEIWKSNLTHPRDKNLGIPNVLNNDKNIIILGDPGAGKSLLVKFIIVKLLLNKSEEIGIKKHRNSIPFRIELRKFNEERENKNILEYLTELLRKEYQLETNKTVIENILNKLPTLFFFDGLDEIFNPVHKNKVKQAIEQFSKIYSLSKCVVTSRFIGYNDVSFNKKLFKEYSIISFNEEQVKKLIKNFFATQFLNQTRRNEYTDNCISQVSEIDKDLKSNPLILTLILILSSNNINIPESKLEIYESCTNTLVDSIDDQAKNLKFTLKIKNKRRTFGNLAYSQYESMTSGITFTYEKALNVVSKYLIEKQEFREYDQAESAAKEFLDYAERRSIYFENNFTHKTFLEYYTADFIFIKYHSKGDYSARDKIITSFIGNPFWHIVFELLFAKIDKDQEGNEIMDALIEKQLRTINSYKIFFLINNIFKLKNISDVNKSKVIRHGILLCINDKDIKFDSYNSEDNIFYVLKKLILTDKIECIDTIQQVINILENELTEEHDLINLYTLHGELNSRIADKDSKNKISLKNEHTVESLEKKNLSLFITRNITKKDQLINVMISQASLFGVNSLFENTMLKYEQHVFFIPTFDIFIIRQIEEGNFENLKANYHTLLEKSKIEASIFLQEIKESKTLFFYREQSLEKTINLYFKSNDNAIDDLLLRLIAISKADIHILIDKFKVKTDKQKLTKLNNYIINYRIENHGKKHPPMIS